MATKTTGSGRAPGLETWNPNIKAPGINKGTGAYFRGDVAGEPDYTQMNDAIQSSILQATKDVGKALNMYENDPSNPNGKGSLLKNKPDLIIHAAARVGGIQANIKNPILFLKCSSFPLIFLPSMKMSPLSASNIPIIHLIVVVFPAPFGPKKP